MGKGNLEKALQLAGNQHKYQIILISLFSLLWIQLNSVLLGTSLMYMDPIFRCSSTGDRDILESQACPMINECKIKNGFTIVGQLQLYCDKQWARDTTQAILAIGAFTGLIMLNLVSDTRGRKYSARISMTLLILGTYFSFVGVVFKIIPLVIIGQFLSGFGAFSLFSLTYAIFSDLCSSNLLSKGILAVNAAWGVSTIFLGLFAIWEVNWFYYQVYMIIAPSLVICIALYNYLIESPYILFGMDKRTQALNSLLKIAKINGFQANISQIQQILRLQVAKDLQSKANLRNVLRTIKQWKYLKQILLLILIYGIGGLNYFGTSFAFINDGYGYGVNSVIAGFIQIFSLFSLNFYIHKLSRKKGIGLMYLVSLVLSMGFLFQFVLDSPMIQTVILGLSRITASISYTLIACMQVEAFTVEIQSTAVGIIEAFSLYGTFFAPLVVDLAEKIGVHPIVFLAIFLNFAIWPTAFMKQTLKKQTESNQLSEKLISEEYSNFSQSLITKSEDQSKTNL